MHYLLLNNLISNKLAQAICWTLVHSLWQGLFFALCAGITILCTKNKSSLIRYNIITTLFFSFIIVSGLTFRYEWQQSGIIHEALSANNQNIFSVFLSSYQIPAYLQQINQFLSHYANYIVLIWLISFAVKFFQTIGAIAFTYRIRTRHIYPVSNEWTAKVETFCASLGIEKHVKLLESGLTRIPLVIGHFKPIIFIPVGLLSQIPADQVEAVLWHELAHIRRNDYFINFFQHIAEAIFFFNPGLIWISSLLRSERENCCDDIAIGQTNNKKQFIEALISFKEYAINNPTIFPAFPGQKNQLLQRVSRIVNRQNKSLHPAEKIFLLAGIVLLTAFISISTHLVPDKIIAKSGQTASAIHPIIAEEKQQKRTTTPNKLIPFEPLKKNTEPHNRNEKININKNLPESAAKEQVSNHQQENEIPEILITKEKMETDRRQVKLEQEKVYFERDRAATEKYRAQLDKLMAENDARKAEADRQISAMAIIQAKLDREKSQQSQKIIESKAVQKNFQKGVL